MDVSVCSHSRKLELRFCCVVCGRPLTGVCYRFYLNTGLALAAASTTLILYMGVYLSYIKRITMEWSEYCPNVIYAASLFGFLAGLMYVKLIWMQRCRLLSDVVTR